MPTYRTGTNAYAIQSFSSGSTGYILNVASQVTAEPRGVITTPPLVAQRVWVIPDEAYDWQVGEEEVEGVSGDATATPATIAVTVSVLAPTVQANAIVQPATVAVTVSVPAPTLASNQTVTPSTVAATVSVPAPTVRGTAVTAPSTVAATVSVPAPTVRGTAIVQPATVAATVALPAPTIIAEGGGAALVTPATVAVLAAVPAPTVLAGATPTPGTIAVLAAIPVPTIRGTASVSPSVVITVVTVPAVTIFTVQPAPPVKGPTRKLVLSGADVESLGLFGPVDTVDSLWIPLLDDPNFSVDGAVFIGSAHFGEQGGIESLNGDATDAEELVGAPRAVMIGAGHNDLEEV